VPASKTSSRRLALAIVPVAGAGCLRDCDSRRPMRKLSEKVADTLPSIDEGADSGSAAPPPAVGAGVAARRRRRHGGW
jgi:hypothetical protein